MTEKKLLHHRRTYTRVFSYKGGRIRAQDGERQTPWVRPHDESLASWSEATARVRDILDTE